MNEKGMKNAHIQFALYKIQNSNNLRGLCDDCEHMPMNYH